MSKTIFITGASTGIGRETAIYFAERGWQVSATMRTPSKGGELLKYPNLKVIRMDVLDPETVKKAIEETLSAFGTIDVLFNNAGYALVGAFEAMTDDRIKKQFDTNVFGVMNVTRALLPHFRQKRNGTIINTTSMGGLITFPLYSVYHATKWAVEGFMESLQYELRPFNIRVKNVEPGAIKTEFESAIDFVDSKDYENYAPRVHQNMLDSYKSAPGAVVVAKKVFAAANDRSFRLRYPAGNNSGLLLFLKRILPNSWFFGIVRMATENGLKKPVPGS